MRHACVVNVGLFRSGTTSLTKAAERLDPNLKAYREFPDDLSQNELKEFLQNPEKAVSDWYRKNGKAEIIRLASENDFVCDGWFALLPFLGTTLLEQLKQEAADVGVELKFIATIRDVESTVASA